VELGNKGREGNNFPPNTVSIIPTPEDGSVKTETTSVWSWPMPRSVSCWLGISERDGTTYLVLRLNMFHPWKEALALGCAAKAKVWVWHDPQIMQTTVPMLKIRQKQSWHCFLTGKSQSLIVCCNKTKEGSRGTPIQLERERAKAPTPRKAEGEDKEEEQRRRFAHPDPVMQCTGDQDFRIIDGLVCQLSTATNSVYVHH
jgi:hypothetical protein